MFNVSYFHYREINESNFLYRDIKVDYFHYREKILVEDDGIEPPTPCL